MEPQNSIMAQYKALFRADGVALEINDDALESICEKAMQKNTGARALRSIIEEILLDIMFEIPKDDNIARVTITKDYIEGRGCPFLEMR